MNKIAEGVYWACVVFMMVVAVVYGAMTGWEGVVGPFKHGFLDEVVGPALWLFPSSLMLGWMFLFFAQPDPSAHWIVVFVLIHEFLTLALAVWFYRSRRASLCLRGAVLAGLLVVGAAPWGLANLFLF